MILEVLEFYERQSRLELTKRSQVEAGGWSWLINSFSDGSRKIEATDLLPFSQEVKRLTRKMPKQTAEILAALLRQGRLPDAAIGAAASFDEVTELLGDDLEALG